MHNVNSYFEKTERIKLTKMNFYFLTFIIQVTNA